MPTDKYVNTFSLLLSVKHAWGDELKHSFEELFPCLVLFCFGLVCLFLFVCLFVVVVVVVFCTLL